MPCGTKTNYPRMKPCHERLRSELSTRVTDIFIEAQFVIVQLTTAVTLTQTLLGSKTFLWKVEQ